jgi:hypothetical protein
VIGIGGCDQKTKKIRIGFITGTHGFRSAEQTTVAAFRRMSELANRNSVLPSEDL